ncbi:MAG: hypothetical protein KAJ96_05655, partial [Candidatus Thorarchaeota archaeon]|nr:hypothetical protein [Candidatus Thorarchaeota archaeon]
FCFFHSFTVSWSAESNLRRRFIIVWHLLGGCVRLRPDSLLYGNLDKSMHDRFTTEINSRAGALETGAD